MKGDDLSWTYFQIGNYLQGDDLVNIRLAIMDISSHCLSASRDHDGSCFKQLEIMKIL